jgi:hypothetical protein
MKTRISYEVLRHPTSQSTLEKLKQEGNYIIGAEVTDTSLKGLLDQNIDPQHTDKRIDTCATDAAFKQFESIIREAGDRPIALVTNKADLDSIGAMAILTMAAENRIEALKTAGVEDRVKDINDYDNFTTTEKWTPKNRAETVHRGDKVGGINTAVNDNQLTLKARVEMMENYLISGVQPLEYIEKYKDELNQIEQALESKDIMIHVVSAKGYNIAVVKSSYSKGLELGYSEAPIVIAYDEKFAPNKAITPHLKYTICQYTDQSRVNFIKFAECLNEKDPVVKDSGKKWGGSPNIIGSPQGLSPLLSLDDIQGALIDNLLPLNETEALGNIEEMAS